jgi:ABC-type sugar transport system, periplasmic component
MRLLRLVPALLVFPILMSGCLGHKNNTPDVTDMNEATQPVIQLNAITMGNPPASGMDSFYKQLDALTIRDFGMKVRFDFIPWDEEKSNIGMAIASKKYDFYVGGSWSDFKSFAAKNAFVNLTPLLGEVPGLVEHYKGMLDQVKIDGKLYGIPQLNVPGAGSEGMFYREDLRKKWQLPEINNFHTLEQYLYKAKEEFPNTPMIIDKRYSDNLWLALTGDKYYKVTEYAIAPIKDPYKVISLFDTPEYKMMVTKAKQWYDDGIVDHDILGAQENETTKTLALMKDNKKPLEFNNHFGAVSNSYITALKTAYPEQEYGWMDYKFDMFPDTVFLPNTSINILTQISIGSNSLYPEIALKFLEKAHTDQTYYNLLVYGVEGENYKLADGKISYDGIPEKNKKQSWTGLIDGYMGVPIRYPDEWQAIVDKLTITEGPKLAEQNGNDPYQNFLFDTSSLFEQLSNLETVQEQYIQPLNLGISTDIDHDLAVLKTKLKEAGIDRYMDVLQKQLDPLAKQHDERT